MTKPLTASRPLTVGELRRALDGLPADRLVEVDAGVNLPPHGGVVRGMTVLYVSEAQSGPYPPCVRLRAEGGVLV